MRQHTLIIRPEHAARTSSRFILIMCHVVVHFPTVGTEPMDIISLDNGNPWPPVRYGALSSCNSRQVAILRATARRVREEAVRPVRPATGDGDAGSGGVTEAARSREKTRYRTWSRDDSDLYEFT